MMSKTDHINKTDEQEANNNNGSQNPKPSLFTSARAQAALRGQPTTLTGREPQSQENKVAEVSETEDEPNTGLAEVRNPELQLPQPFHYIATDLIDPNPFYNLFRTKEELAWQYQAQIKKFAELFKENRLAEFVVLVRLHPEYSNRYQLVYGHLRFRGAVMADKKYLPAVIQNLSDEEMLIRLTEENQLRSPVAKLSMALQVGYMRDQLKWQFKYIAGLFGIPTSSCYDLYYISKAPQPFLNFMSQHPEYFQSIAELVRRNLTIAQQTEILDLLEAGEVSPRELKAKVRELGASNPPSLKRTPTRPGKI